jgi:hypothetical protein
MVITSLATFEVNVELPPPPRIAVKLLEMLSWDIPTKFGMN